mmetsp:Transcript_74853/g.216380  ORF Transcript_74853/g.216380 Transcript_74853/m.216380 type:complete len:568 (+) Transcript_74853:90-1793(+)
MGNAQPQDAHGDLALVRTRLQRDVGFIPITGRYHQLPRRITDDYDLGTGVELGNGFNGAVIMAKSKTNGENVAVKTFKLLGLSKTERRTLKNEVELFLGMDHPHIARLHDVYEADTELTLVMELLSGGELLQRVQEKRDFEEDEAQMTTWMMLLAINYLHAKNIVHRDIKLENFLYDSREFRFLKLIDFGFSRFHRSAKKMQLGCGTVAYMAPEVIENSYDNKCDLWSTGVIVFVLLTGAMPFTGPDEAKVEKILKGEIEIHEPVWSRLSDDARAFVGRLLVVQPTARMSAREALAHPWLQSCAMKIRDTATAAGIDNAVVNSMVKFATHSKFRRACFSMMAWSLTNAERAQVREDFMRMDQGNTGTIRLEDLKRVLMKHAQLPDAEVRKIFAAMADDNPDEINYSDFLAAMVSTRIAMHDDLLRAAFHRFDIDGSGLVTRANLRTALGEVCTQEEVDQIIQEVAASGDNGITLEDFIDYLKGAPAENHTQAAEKVIEREQVIRASVLDRDGLVKAVSIRPFKKSQTMPEAGDKGRLAPPRSPTREGGFWLKRSNTMVAPSVACTIS